MKDTIQYHKNLFKPLKSCTTEFNIAGFDIETYGYDNDFYMGSVYYDKGIEVFYEQEDMKSFIIDNLHGYIVFAHNLQFDIGIFWNQIKDGSMRILKGSASVICASYPYKSKNGQQIIKFYDTMNFIKLPLRKIGRIINIEKMETPDFIGRKPKNKKQKEYLEKYNIQDSRIVYEFGCMLQRFYLKQGIKLKPTVSSCAMAIYRTNYFKSMYKQIGKIHLPFIYGSYAGGRTEVFKRGLVKNIYDYDVNSMYPYVMKENEFPVTVGLYWAYDNRYLHKEGFSDAIIRCPKMYIPYLHNRQDKLLFPTGKFRGKYTNYELRTAKSLGYDIQIIKSLIFPKTANIFEEYVDDMYNGRMECQSNNDIREIFYKMNMNSLYGKFAQKSNDKYIIESSLGMTIKKLGSYLSRGYEVKKENGFYFIKDIKGNRYPNFVMPFWSSYVTAYARTQLFRHFEDVGLDNVYYCDTDSIFTSKKIPQSRELGKLKLEQKLNEAVIVKPKVYGIKDGAVRVKGFRIETEKEFNDLLRTRKAEYNTFVKIGSAMRFGKKLNQHQRVVKNIDLEDNKRLWKGLFNPLELEDSRPKVI